MKYVASGMDVYELRGCLHRGRRHVFEFKGHNIDRPGKLADRIDVFILRAGLDIGDLAGWGVGQRRKGVDAIAHLAGLDREHTTELPAAENAYS